MPKKATAQKPADEFEETPLLDDTADLSDDMTVVIPVSGADLSDDTLEPVPDDFEEEDEDWQEEDVTANQSYLDDISDDSVRLYLREIGKIKLLTPDEEFELAQRIKHGDEAKKELETVKAGTKKHGEIEKLVKDGRGAKDKMAQANLRLVVSIAKRYSGRGL